MSVILRTATGYAVFPRLDGSLIDMPMPAVAAGINLTAPTLSSAKIGMAFTIGSGTWSGAPVIQRDLMRDGAVLLSGVAAGSGYTPVAGDDLKTFQVREYPNGDISKAVYSPAVVVTYAAPVWNTPISDQIFVQGSGSHTIDASGLVSGSNLTWTISGPAGIEINDGVITIPSATAHAATDVTPMATNSGGSASDTFTVTITDAAPVSSGVTLPDQSYSRNTGTKTFDASVGFIGSNLVFTLTGSPPAGVTIGASTGIVSTNTVNLISATSVTVRATNGGGNLDRAISIAVVVATGAAPTLTGAAIPSRLGMIRGVSQTLSAAPSFAGAIDTWSVTGIGVTIDSAGLMTFANSATIAAQTVTVTASNAFGSISTTFAMSVAMAVIDLANLTTTWRTDPTGQSAPSATPKAVPAGFATWCFDIDESKLPQPITVLGWRPDADPGATSMGTGYHMCIRQSPQPGGLPAGVARWFARRCNPSTGATEIASWLDVVGSGVVGASRTHQFIWSSDPVVSDLRSLEYSAASAALVAVVTLTGAPAFTVAPSLSPSSGGAGTTFSIVDGTATGDPTPTISRRMLLNGTAVANPYIAAAADVGKTLTAENTATSTLGSATSSFGITVGAASATYATVSTVAALVTAMANCPAGQTIKVTGGNIFGSGVVAARNVASPGITIEAADPTNPPIFRGMASTTNEDTDAEYATALELQGFQGATFRNIIWKNTKRDWRNGPGRSEASDLNGAGGRWVPFGLRLTNSCKRITIQDCEFDGWFGSLDSTGVDFLTVEYCTFKNCHCDNMRVYNRHLTLRIRNCWFYSRSINKSWQTDINRHPDDIQAAMTSSNTTYWEDVVIENNYHDVGQNNTDTHGVFLFAEKVYRTPWYDVLSSGHRDVTIQKNYYRGTNTQTMAVGGAFRVTFDSNKLELYPGDSNDGYHTPTAHLIRSAVESASTPAAYAQKVAYQDIVYTNNAWPYLSGGSSLYFGPGKRTGNIDMGGDSGRPVRVTPSSGNGTNINVATGNPAGWSGFDAATAPIDGQRRYGRNGLR